MGGVGGDAKVTEDLSLSLYIYVSRTWSDGGSDVEDPRGDVPSPGQQDHPVPPPRLAQGHAIFLSMRMMIRDHPG